MRLIAPSWIGLCLACMTGLPLPLSAAEDSAPAETEVTASAAVREGPRQGMPLGNTGIRLGGYGEAIYSDLDGEQNALAVDGLSLFLWWNHGARWHFFSEVEVEDALIVRRGDTTTDEAHVISERLYLDYVHSDALKFRAGKFLTPVGRWNAIHAPPLTWTTSRPLITESTFPTNASGLMVLGVLPFTRDGVEYSVYGSVGEEIFPARGVDSFSEAIGFRLAATLLPYTEFGFSYVNFEQESSQDEHKNLIGFDFAWQRHRIEISGEYAYRTIAKNTDTRDEDGGYLQVVVPLTQRLYAVARYEGFFGADQNSRLTQYLGGLTLRWSPNWTFKAEYLRTTDNDFDRPDGFLASAAILF